MTRTRLTRGFKGLVALLALAVLGQACSHADPVRAGAAAAAPALLDTRWALVRLGGAEVAPDATQRQAYIQLQRQDGRVSGSLGCNAINGAYTLGGAQLSFGPLRSTRMACLKGMDIEQGLGDALERTAGWKMAGAQLELDDAAGQPLARFEARPAQ